MTVGDPQWRRAAAIDDVQEGQAFACVIEGQPVVLFRLGEEFYALRDQCSHGEARLSDGYVDDDCIECPLHQGLIEIRTGEPKSAPVTEPVAAYETRIADGLVEVWI